MMETQGLWYKGNDLTADTGAKTISSGWGRKRYREVALFSTSSDPQRPLLSALIREGHHLPALSCLAAPLVWPVLCIIFLLASHPSQVSLLVEEIQELKEEEASLGLAV